MERRNLIIIAVAGIVAVVIGVTAATAFGLDVGILSGALGPGFDGPLPP
jgi:hypothetical protein